jgi:pentatricopeptide repeat protein
MRTAFSPCPPSSGDWESAVKQLKQSASEGADHPQLAPNTITYSTVIEACARTGHLDVAVDLFREMVAAGECCWSALGLHSSLSAAGLPWGHCVRPVILVMHTLLQMGESLARVNHWQLCHIME